MNEPITAEVVESQALAIRQRQELDRAGLFGVKEPLEIVARAEQVATALKSVIVKQGLVSKIQGKEYAKCEAWTLLGTMLGVFPVLVWSKPVEGGWEARVEARTKDGAVIGAAEAQCLRAERNWANRDDFALRSMAQTRATAKCLRMPLGFVMSLSGFEVTPAEEMVADHPHAQVPVTPAPQPTVEPKPAVTSRFPTDMHRAKMIANLKAGPGDDNREITTEYFRKCDQLLPTEEIEDLPLRFVPATKEEMNDLASLIMGFSCGGRAAPAFDPHEEPDEPQVIKAIKEHKSDTKEQFWDILITMPRKGMKKAEYLKNPDTIRKLFELRHGNDDEAQAARQRLWGLCNHFEAKPWTGNDGKEHAPSDGDVKCYQALQQFKSWFSINHPDEKL